MHPLSIRVDTGPMPPTIRAKALLFTAPQEVELQAQILEPPRGDQLLVQTIASAVSAGSEMLVYRGQLPADVPLDATLPALSGAPAYPLRYGYAAVGRVIALGERANAAWLDQLVFSFQPHGSHFVTRSDQLIPLPAGISPEAAVFLPNMETAVSFLMDGRPMIGEQVTVWGQGVVGLLTTALLSRMPLGKLLTFDPLPLRRQWSSTLGAHRSLAPDSKEAAEALSAGLQHGPNANGADLAFELTGNPQALNAAIASASFEGRIVVGSWYGDKEATLNLGGRFHRQRLHLISSQVSHIASAWRGRFDKERRLQSAWRMLQEIEPQQLITHRFPLQQAAEAYRLLDQRPEEVVQLVLTYGEEPL